MGDVFVPEVALSALEGPAGGQVQVQDLVVKFRDGEAGPVVLAALWLGAGRLRSRIAAQERMKDVCKELRSSVSSSVSIDFGGSHDGIRCHHLSLN